MTTIASRIATAIAIGTSFESPSARLEPPTATTKRISSVAYAVDEIASDEKTASAIVFGIRWCSCSVVASGRPTRTRLTNATSSDPPSPWERPAADSMPSRPVGHRPVSPIALLRQTAVSDSNRRDQTGTLRRFGRRRESSVHVVVIGCGRVGSELAGASSRRATRVAVVDKNAARVPAPPGATSPARRSSASASTATTSPQAGIERGRGVRRRSRAATTPTSSCARIARENLRHRARRRPHLRPPAGADLPAARHPDGRDRRVDHRPGAAAAPARPRPRNDWVDPTGKVGLVERPIPAKAVGKKLAPLSQPGPLLAHRGHPASARRRSCTADLVGQEGDVLVLRRRRRRRSTSCRRTSKHGGEH